MSEIKAAEEVARIAGAKWELLDVPLVGSLGKNSLTCPDVKMDQEKPADSVPNTFVPGRNLFFLSIAAVYARERGIRHLVTGVGQTDFSGYPDCRDTFVKSLNVTLNLAMEEQFVIHTPLMWIDKKETWAMADELGVLDIVKENRNLLQWCSRRWLWSLSGLQTSQARIGELSERKKEEIK